MHTPTDGLVATVYESPSCTGLSKALYESDFIGGRHDDGWNACNSNYDGGTPMSYQSGTWLHSFEVHSGFSVNTASKCDDDWWHASLPWKDTDVTVADGCVDATYDFNFVNFVAGRSLLHSNVPQRPVTTKGIHLRGFHSG